MALLFSDGLSPWDSHSSEVFREQYGSGLVRGKVLLITSQKQVYCKIVLILVFGKWRQEVQFKATRLCLSN